MFGRLYIGNVPSGSTAADLTTLIQKVCNVQDVYVPGGTITGIIRSFAIVSVDNDEVAIAKCVKAFNNCRWKGANILVEVAKQHYPERREQERIEEIARAKKQKEDQIAFDAESIDHGIVCEPTDRGDDFMLRVKRTRFEEHMLIYRETSKSRRPYDGNRQLATSKQTIFDSDGNVQTVNKLLVTTKDHIRTGGHHDVVESVVNYEYAAPSRKPDSTGELKDGVIIFDDSEAPAVAPPLSSRERKIVADEKTVEKNDKNVKMEGGGQRTGFGALLTASASAMKEPLSSKKDPLSNQRTKFSRKEVVEENDNKHVFESEDEEEEEIPCVSAEELETDALRTEKNRYCDMLHSVMVQAAADRAAAPPPKPIVKKEKKKNDDSYFKKKRFGDTDFIVEPSIADPVVVEEEKKEVKVNRLVPVLSIAGESVQYGTRVVKERNIKPLPAPASASASAVEPVSRTPASTDTGSSHNSSSSDNSSNTADSGTIHVTSAIEPKSILKSKLKLVEPKLELIDAVDMPEVGGNKVKARKERKDKAVKIVSDEDIKEATEESKDFANISELTSIFHREGGLSWSKLGSKHEDFKQEDSVIRQPDSAVSDVPQTAVPDVEGATPQDVIFMEAEKVGLDTRESGTGFSFGFFGEPALVSSASVAHGSTDTGSKPNAAVDAEPSSEQDSCKLLDAAVASSLLGSAVSDVGSAAAAAPTTPLVSMPSLRGVLDLAQLFCRQKTKDDLVDDWKNNRDKLITDYKRKRKDARVKVELKRKKGTGGGGDEKKQEDESAASASPRPNSYKGKSKRGGAKHKKTVVKNDI